MWYKFKKLLNYLVIVIVVITSIPITSLAGGMGDNDNSGAGGGGVQTGGFTWNQAQSGYRFTIVDRNFKPVSKSVDILFSDPSGKQFSYGKDGANFYTNPRTSTGLSNSQSNFERITFQFLLDNKIIDKAPPVPIATSGSNAVARGAEFREWFLDGKGGFSIPKPPPVYTPSTGKSTSRPTSNSKPSSQSKAGSGGSGGGEKLPDSVHGDGEKPDFLKGKGHQEGDVVTSDWENDTGILE